jgi:endonuclease/exonuclease/phosphatase family metal-dependent hydrolase
MSTRSTRSWFVAVSLGVMLAGACSGQQQETRKETPETVEEAARRRPPRDAGVVTPDGGVADAGAGTVDAGVADAGVVDAGVVEADAGTRDAGFTHVRIMAANLTSGNGQSYDPGNGLRLMKGVAPDIVLLQEFNYKRNTPDDLRELVETTFGPEFHFHRESESSDKIPNGIISRWPIRESGEWKDTTGGGSNRDYAWARIDLPGERDLWAVSVHLWSGGGSSGRNAEARELARAIQEKVPAADYLVVGGDFNTDSRSESALNVLSSVVTTSGPHPADQGGNGNTNRSRKKPYDHVLVDADLRAHQTATVIGGSTFPSGLVLDSETYRPLSEIAPVRQGDSRSTNMQHMGVIKDFRVPAD